MFVARVKSKGKNGKIYESVLLRESVRIGAKVSSRTLAILTKLPDWLVSKIEAAIINDGSETETDNDAISPTQALATLGDSAESTLIIKQKESLGALWLVKSVADQLGIPHALRPANCPRNDRQSFDHDFSQIALLRVCARVLVPGISLLGLTRFVNQSCARRLFSWKNSWTEDDLYERHGAWLDQRQSTIEKSLWEKNHPQKKTSAQADSESTEDLFLYDVTSSYFEGTNNELSAFGYNRDGKKGKMQVVIGLLTDSTGDPCSIKAYSGETRDYDTFSDVLEQAQTDFKSRNLVMVGDRGMIKSKQIKAIEEANGHYISSLTKPQITKLVRTCVIQLDLFDEDLAEVNDEEAGERYVLRRNPVRQEEMKVSRSERTASLQIQVEKSNTYLQEHPGGKFEVQVKHLEAKLKKLRLKKWLSIESDHKKRQVKIVTDDDALREEEKLDGCYALRTNLNKEQSTAENVHDRYKALAEVEMDFRTMKTGHLEIRPFFVIKEENTRAHALTTMLALKIRRHLAHAWKDENLTVEEGLRQMESLSILSINDGKQGSSHELLAQPSDLQARLLKLAGVTLPKVVPAVEAAPVVTRKQLPEERRYA